MFGTPNSLSLKLRFRIHTSITEVDAVGWDAIASNRNLYLCTSYLKALEESLTDTDFRYLTFYKDERLVGIASVQVLELRRVNKESGEIPCFIGSRIHKTINSSLDVKVMTCGNAFSTGENGFLHLPEIRYEDFYDNLSDALQSLSKNDELNAGASLILLKEFWPQTAEKVSHLENADFRPFEIDVNMVLKIHPGWKTLEDYLDSMTTKYRTKAKSVFKKSAELTVRQLSAQEMKQYRERIADLYLSVAAKAEYSFGLLNGDSFVSLKERLNEHFIFSAYFLNDKMIGFSSAFSCGDILEANYVGMDYSVNIRYALYQRMLYDLVEAALAGSFTELRLGRTSEEIKSCLGAMPVEMKLFLRHRHSLSNHLLKPFISIISPSDYTLRYPFKAEFSYS